MEKSKTSLVAVIGILNSFLINSKINVVSLIKSNMILIGIDRFQFCRAREGEELLLTPLVNFSQKQSKVN